ncbi:hypothetical protein VTL71DRAFT_13082 [Oculimacula yallundae]|uniref:Heterokaryon incompatibility domain-containing protein n=1 Tax=Oculimacula yallundae TaxID=86028 RepID=A0ABR4CPX7_9HELO
MNISGSYPYKPLDPGSSDAIRLLVLQPDADIHAPVKCDLINTTLSDYDDDVVEHYSALSYVWGDPIEVKEISVDGTSFHVTANLDSALRHMRDASRSRKVWADAICINQTDNEEKSNQVQQMRAVYNTARHTIIYLGDATEESNFLLEYVRRSLKSVAVNIRGFSDEETKRLSDWSAILSRPWFTRVWIFQELVFSNDPWIQCGEVRARWDKVREVMQRVQEHLPAFVKGTNLFHSMDKRRAEIRDGAKFRRKLSRAETASSLYDLLDSRRGMGVTDSRDMLFAHMGMMSAHMEIIKEFDPAVGHLLDIDYGKSHSQVFRDLARYLLRNQAQSPMELVHTNFQPSEPMCLLSHIETCTSSQGHDTRLPSWVPDWSSRRPLHRRLRLTAPELYTFCESWHITAGLEARFLNQGLFNFWPEKCIFACLGYHVGTILHISPEVRSVNDFNDELLPKTSEKVQQEGWQALAVLWQEICFNRSSTKAGDILHERYDQIIAKVPDLFVPDRPPGALPMSELGNKVSRPPKDTLVEQFQNRMNGLDQLKETRHKSLLGKIPKITITTETLDHLDADDDDDSGNSDDNVCHGRRLAILDNGKLCLVPNSASIDDLVCCFLGDLRVQYTLRRKTDGVGSTDSIDLEIRRELGSDAPVIHCQFVGESLLDGWRQWSTMRAFHELLMDKDVDTESNFDYWRKGSPEMTIGQVFALH